MRVDLKKEVAIVTGGAQGIGRAIGFELARQGCAIALIDLDEPALAATTAEMRSLGWDVGVAVADVSRAGPVAAAPLTARFTGFLEGTAAAGFATGIAAYWATELAYLDAWGSVRARVGSTGPYTGWIENWTSPAFAAFVDGLGSLVDRHADAGTAPGRALTVLAFERAFWRSCWEG